MAIHVRLPRYIHIHRFYPHAQQSAYSGGKIGANTRMASHAPTGVLTNAGTFSRTRVRNPRRSASLAENVDL